MVDMLELQKAVYQNKVDHDFNLTDIPLEFCLLYGEVSEALGALLRKNGEGFGEELADIAIYLLGIAQITGVNLEAEILAKMEKNRKRKYVRLENGAQVKIGEENAAEGKRE